MLLYACLCLVVDLLTLPQIKIHFISSQAISLLLGWLKAGSLHLVYIIMLLNSWNNFLMTQDCNLSLAVYNTSRPFPLIGEPDTSLTENNLKTLKWVKHCRLVDSLEFTLLSQQVHRNSQNKLNWLWTWRLHNLVSIAVRGTLLHQRVNILETSNWCKRLPNVHCPWKITFVFAWHYYCSIYIYRIFQSWAKALVIELFTEPGMNAYYLYKAVALLAMSI